MYGLPGTEACQWTAFRRATVRNSPRSRCPRSSIRRPSSTSLEAPTTHSMPWTARERCGASGQRIKGLGLSGADGYDSKLFSKVPIYDVVPKAFQYTPTLTLENPNPDYGATIEFKNPNNRAFINLDDQTSEFRLGFVDNEYDAGQFNGMRLAADRLAIGNRAGQSAQGSFSVAIGYEAGSFVTRGPGCCGWIPNRAVGTSVLRCCDWVRRRVFVTRVHRDGRLGLAPGIRHKGNSRRRLGIAPGRSHKGPRPLRLVISPG